VIETLKSAVRRATSLAAIVAVATLLAASTRAADELDTKSDLSPFSLRLGVYDMNLSTEIRVDGRGGNFGTRLNFERDLNLDDNKVRVDGRGGNFGTRLNFERDLNLDDHKDTFNAALRWRFKERHFLELEYFRLGFKERHFLELEYFRLDRSGFRRLDGEIRFGDNVFPIGASIRSSFTTEVTRLSYSYRIVRNRDWGLAVGAGLHVTRLRAALTEIAIGTTEIAKVTAPLPVIGFGGARRLGTNWALLARAQVFSVEIDDIDGTITHGAMYFEHDTFSFGVAE
jgi:hypothetical protein